MTEPLYMSQESPSDPPRTRIHRHTACEEAVPSLDSAEHDTVTNRSLALRPMFPGSRSLLDQCKAYIRHTRKQKPVAFSRSRIRKSTRGDILQLHRALRVSDRYRRGPGQELVNDGLGGMGSGAVDGSLYGAKDPGQFFWGASSRDIVASAVKEFLAVVVVAKSNQGIA